VQADEIASEVDSPSIHSSQTGSIAGRESCAEIPYAVPLRQEARNHDHALRVAGAAQPPALVNRRHPRGYTRLPTTERRAPGGSSPNNGRAEDGLRAHGPRLQDRPPHEAHERNAWPKPRAGGPKHV